MNGKPLKQKPISPSLKEKRRYVVFEIQSFSPLTLQDTQQFIVAMYRDLFGMYGLAQAGLQFLSDWKNQKGIVRVSTKSLHLLQATFVHAQTFKNSPCFIRTVGVSGLLNKARQNYLEVL